MRGVPCARGLRAAACGLQVRTAETRCLHRRMCPLLSPSRSAAASEEGSLECTCECARPRGASHLSAHHVLRSFAVISTELNLCAARPPPRAHGLTSSFMPHRDWGGLRDLRFKRGSARTPPRMPRVQGPPRLREWSCGRGLHLMCARRRTLLRLSPTATARYSTRTRAWTSGRSGIDVHPKEGAVPAGGVSIGVRGQLYPARRQSRTPLPVHALATA
ncbi:hypothetical protein B0H17DRAFT_197930 [Mycena rosella]|uniref:Uncharacterized protein n=1 Tax=Mycena rosella TaxID=1033263 RepID=A0AAD7GAA7_MYCRO|nr:hypothetical protein B0H17DRAFT_197930 [Mycena rosella]